MAVPRWRSPCKKTAKVKEITWFCVIWILIAHNSRFSVFNAHFCAASFVLYGRCQCHRTTDAVSQCWWVNTYLQDGTIFCNHSGILNQLMIDKFTADINRTKTSICCLILGLLQYWIDYWIVKQWRSTRAKTNEMPFLNFLLVFTARRSYASAVLGVVILSVRPSVSLSARLSHACFVTNQRTYRRYFYTIWKGK